MPGSGDAGQRVDNFDLVGDRPFPGWVKRWSPVVVMMVALVAWAIALACGGSGRSGPDVATPTATTPTGTVMANAIEYVPGTVVADHTRLGDPFFASTGEHGLFQLSGVSDVVAASTAWVPRGRDVAAWVLLEDGTVVGWGDNTDGRLGHGSAGPVDAPVVVPGLPEARSLASNSSGTYLLAADGSVWAWGVDGFAVGLPADEVPHSIPQQVSGLSGIVAVTVSSQQCAHALGSDGTVWTWGMCMEGGAPVAVAQMPGAVAIAGTTERLMVLLDDGTVWWVASYYDDADAPAQVPDLSGIVAVDGTIDNFAAVTATGDLWHCKVEGVAGWAVEKTALRGIVQASAAWSHALDSDGTVWHYGERERHKDEDGNGVGRVAGLPPVAFIGADAFTVTELFVVGRP